MQKNRRKAGFFMKEAASTESGSYLAASTMYWMAALKSASEAVEPPLGGMAPTPWVAF